MKTLNALYIILLNFYKDNGMDIEFICNTVDRLLVKSIITCEEYTSLMEHFISQYPTAELHPEFFNDKLFVPYDERYGTGGAWFLIGRYPVEGYEIRVRFLEKMVLITENK